MGPLPCEALVAEQRCWTAARVEYTDKGHDELQLKFDHQEEFQAGAATNPAIVAAQAAKSRPLRRAAKVAAKAKTMPCGSSPGGRSSSASTSSSSPS